MKDNSEFVIPVIVYLYFFDIVHINKDAIFSLKEFHQSNQELRLESDSDRRPSTLVSICVSRIWSTISLILSYLGSPGTNGLYPCLMASHCQLSMCSDNILFLCLSHLHWHYVSHNEYRFNHGHIFLHRGHILVDFIESPVHP